MTAAYIGTPKVRHLAAYVRTDPLQPFGDWRAICGERPGSDQWRRIWGSYTVADPSALSPVARRSFDAAMRKPVCKLCSAVADSLTGLASVGATS